jgi:hypothetical protein
MSKHAMKRTLLLAALAASALMAQPAVAPTNEPVGEPRGRTFGNYSLLQSWELGYRFHSVGGNESKYRSDVNLGNGVRLLGSRLSLHSRDGHGSLFDELVLSTQGLGDDPYEFASFRIGKNKLYRYDLLWRSNEYFNPSDPIAFGLHRMDTVRRMQDHDFTLLPQSRIRFFGGYSRNRQQGAALSTLLFPDLLGDEFPVFSDVDRTQDEYRFGNEIRMAGIRLNWLQVFERWSEQSQYYRREPSQGLNPGDRAVLDSLQRTEPYQGTTPSFRLSLFRESGEHWALNGRFTYSAGRRNFVFDESAVGVSRFGAAANRQIAVSGDARRPVTTGHLTLSVFPAKDWSITNHTGFHSTRIDGLASYREVENSSLAFASTDFSYLGIRNVTNSTDAYWQIKPWIAVRGGYRFAEREIRSREVQTIEDYPYVLDDTQSNRLHAGLAGFRLKPAKGMTLAFDGELGRQSRPFAPTAEKDYHGLSARWQYRANTVSFSALARVFYNFNSVSLSVHSSKTRHYGFDGSWTPADWFSIDAGYAYLHANTATGISYFLTGALISGQQSLWLSNLHTGNLGVRTGFRQRVDFYAGLSLTKDTGGLPAGNAPALPAFLAAQSYPMRFASPLARLSLRLHSKLRWNAGWQYYGYSEELYPLQNYRAHTGYTSLLWAF